MVLPYEINLARRDLSRCPWLTAAMVAGLATAVLVMVYIPSTMSCFYDDLLDRIVEQTSPHITVWPPERHDVQTGRALRGEFGGDALVDLKDRTRPRSHNLNGHHALAKQVASVPGVATVTAFVKGSATISRGRTNLGVELEGIVPAEFARVVSIAKHFDDNRVPKLGPSDIALGFRAAEKLRVHVGEHIRVSTAMTQMLMRVRAVFDSGYYDKDLHSAYVALQTSQRLFRTGNEVSALAARCYNHNEAGIVSAAIENRTSQRVRNWRDDNASLLAQTANVKRVTGFIDALVALATSAGMASVFSIFVSTRQKELAILRAVGASRASLRAILILEALFVWFVGTVIGFTAVLCVMAYEQVNPYEVSAETYGVDSFATYPKFTAFVMAGILAAATMLGSAWWSGRKAAKLNPAEVIFGR